MTSAGFRTGDTIAAIATPTGAGGIGIIRISGLDALAVLHNIFIPQNRNSRPVPYLLRFGRIVGQIENDPLDEVLAVYMPSPRSFTGEDLVEIYCHAGQFSLKAILEVVLGHGCRPAEAGEFSMRRFMNHGVDLTKLEGAAELVSAKTDLAYHLSRQHLIGVYGERIGALRKRIVALLAEIEADIDFPDDVDMTARRKTLPQQLDCIITDLEHLAAGYKIGRLIRDGFRAIILGRPNVGKSSLFNRLIRQKRALVTSIPGTTRDYLSEWIDLDGLPVELFDTAGMRVGRGKIEQAGIAASQRLVARADLILHVIDLKAKTIVLPKIEKKSGQSILVVLNKADLVAEKRIKKAIKTFEGLDCCIISAKTGRGIKELLGKISAKTGLADLTDSLVVTSHRHKVKIDRCLEHLKKIRTQGEVPAEIISFELRQAADQIGEITGQVYTEEILDEIFSRFCIGK